MLPESDNDIFGCVRNPHDKERTSGGSSGGEGALIAARASPAGMGTDIGGSIRIPAAFSGVYGFKPSNVRSSWKGNTPITHDYEEDCFIGIYPISGPLGNSVDDLIMLQRPLFSPEVWKEDPETPPLPFSDEIVEEWANPEKKLKVGYIKNIWLYYPTDPAQDALNKTIDALKEAGHEVVELDEKLFEDIPE